MKVLLFNGSSNENGCTFRALSEIEKVLNKYEFKLLPFKKLYIINYADFFSTDDKILCFDDLERANVDVIDILGYINNFVEHDHIKTIIICNEKELSTKLKSSNIEMKTLLI